jgi:DMSO/TMAO reductase YedYZ heme-binding membrane subunit
MTGRMGKSRNIWLVWLVWPLITLGIYHLVWWYKINREARDLDVGIEVSPAVSVVAITIGALIIVPPWVSIFNTGERIGRMQSAAGAPASCNAILGLIASFFLGLHTLYYQYELNKLWAHLGSAPEGTVVVLPRRPGSSPPDESQAAA